MRWFDEQYGVPRSGHDWGKAHATCSKQTNVPFAQRCVQMGCRMLSLGIDTWVCQRGLRSFQTDYAGVTLAQP